MNQKSLLVISFIFMLSACSTVDRLANTIDDLTVNESYPITFNAEEEAFIDSYIDYLDSGDQRSYNEYIVD